MMGNKLSFRDKLRNAEGTDRLKLINKHLKKKLTPERYIHTLGVSATCVGLAMSLGVSSDRAMLAGLLHDCAKCIPDDIKIKKCREHNIPITAIEYSNPYLLHTKLGAYIAKDKYLVQDEEILSAIRCHTTGKPEMTDLEMLLFVADYIEPNRTKQPNLEYLRTEAFKDIRHCTYLILKDTLDYLHKKGNPIDEMTQKTFDYYKQFYE
jgi:predicted HD superfamily hydrolase involved in NAD metabolism